MRKSANPVFEKTTTWNKDLSVGATLEGVYLSKEEFDGNFGHSIKYVIQANDGTKYGVYGSAALNRQFDMIPAGSYVWIEYTGETTSQNGRTVKTYSVDYDDEYSQ